MPARVRSATGVVKPGLIEDAIAVERELADVRGHAWAKRAVEIAAAGGHNVMRYAATVSRS